MGCLLETADPARQTARLESTRPEKRLSELEKSVSGKCPDLAAGSVTGWPEVEKVKTLKFGSDSSETAYLGHFEISTFSTQNRDQMPTKATPTRKTDEVLRSEIESGGRFGGQNALPGPKLAPELDLGVRMSQFAIVFDLQPQNEPSGVVFRSRIEEPGSRWVGARSSFDARS